MTIMESIGRQYFSYEPVGGHTNDCTQGPGSRWDVATYIEYGFGDQDQDVRHENIRLTCTECGAVKFYRTGHPDYGPGLKIDRTSTAELGFGAAPERVAGVWLWPGPLALYAEKHGPESYLVTAYKVRPSSPGAVVGLVGWARNLARSNGAIRWYAGLGCTEWGSIKEAAPDHFTSRTAAAKWLAGQLATRREGAE